MSWMAKVIRRWQIFRRQNGVPTDKSKWAVVIIDMQAKFLKPKYRKVKVALIKSQVELIKYCIVLDIPVVLVGYDDEGPAALRIEKWLLFVSRCVRVRKSFFSAFRETDLVQQLRVLGIDTLLLTGVNAHACVRDTALDALAEGFTFVTSEKLVADENSDKLGEALRWFGFKGALEDDYLKLLLNTE